jgi:hypothetical protein
MLCVFTQLIFCKTFSQPPNQITKDSTQDVNITNLGKDVTEVKINTKKIDSTVTNLTKKAVNKAKDSLENSDSASIFNAWKYAKAHPETLYAKACEKCDRNLVITIAVFLFLILFLSAVMKAISLKAK